MSIISRRPLRAIGCLVVLGILIALGAFAWHVIRLSDSAERQLMAIRYLNEACRDYLAAHHDWPRS